MDSSVLLRPCDRLPEFDIDRAPSLAAAWKYSAERYEQIGSVIAECLPSFVACAAVSGSLARMEAHDASDIDLILVVDDRETAVTVQEAAAVFDEVWSRLDQIGAVRPKPGGIFAECARWKDLTDSAVKGQVDERLVTFGHRIQLLMDAQPLVAADCFAELQHSLLQWYTEGRLVTVFDEPGVLHWLWQDVQRYWRSLRSRTCWIHADDVAKSLALNVKLRSSRLMLVYSFLLTLQRAQRRSMQLPAVSRSVLNELTRTPAERLFGSSEMIESWESIWMYLRDTATEPPPQVPDAILLKLRELAGVVERAIGVSDDRSSVSPWLF